MSASGEIRCGACGELTPAGGRFCIHCATPVAQVCPTCGEAVVPGARFCMQCASPLPGATSSGTAPKPTAVSERRLVSVLFADLVGFTTLSEHRDPEEVRDLLSQYFDRCRALIERFGGTVEKFIGDAVMAVWGTPVAREDDAERAVRAALSLTQAVTLLGEEVGMPELRVRAGVLTGNAAVEVGVEGEGMVLGDTVNTASRLQSIAAPGTVLVDDVTRRASEAAIDYEDHGEHAVKGRERPVHAWTALRVVAGVGGARRSAGLEAPFVGRERELETIRTVAEDTVSNRTARLVTVVGDAGAGKSRLLWEFFKYIDGIEEVRWWHQGRCLSYGDGVAYWALGEMVRARAAIAEEDGPQAERAKLQAVIERFVGDERERRLIEPRLAQLLGLDRGVAVQAADLFAGWRLFFERMAEAAPVVLAFEDLQWADSGLLDFIDYLLEWSADYPIFILALGRTELEARRPRWGTAIRLDALPHESMHALLGGLVPGLAPDLADRILTRAEGVPLYAVETVRMLLDRGLLRQEGNRYAVSAAIEDLEIPETLQALVAARLDNLDQNERTLLQDAAVLGISFTVKDLAAVSQRSEEEVRRTLDRLVAKQVLGHDLDPRSGEQGLFHFLQALLRAVALGTLSRRDRKARHLAAAAQLSVTSEDDAPELPEVLASHYLAAVEADPDAPDVNEIRGLARITLTTAGRRAASLALGGEARGYFEQAAALADDEAGRAELLAEAGAAAARTADLTAAQALLGRAIEQLEAVGMTAEAGRTRARLADVLMAENRIEDAAVMLDQARETLADEAALAEVAARRGRVAFLSGDFARALTESEQALRIADPRGLTPVVADALMTKAITLFYDSRMTEAAALMATGLELALDADLTEQALRAYYNLAGFHATMGKVQEGRELLERGIALAHERGNRLWDRELLAQRNELLVYVGRWDEALAGATALAAAGDDSSFRLGQQHRPFVYAARGQRAELEEFLGQALAPSEWHELALVETAGRAIALHALDRPADIDGLDEKLLEWVRAFVGSAAMYLTSIIDFLTETGRYDTLEKLVTNSDLVAPAIIDGQCKWGRALLHLHRGEPDQAQAELQQGADTLRGLGSPYPLARVLLELGALLVKADRPQEAGPILREARALLMELRAAPLVQQIDGLLAPSAVHS